MPNANGGWNAGSARFFSFGFPAAAALAFSLFAGSPAFAQMPASGPTPIASSLVADSGVSSSLPDAPAPAGAEPVVDAVPQNAAHSAPGPYGRHETSPYDHLIDPSEIAPRLTPFDKAVMGLKSAVSPYAVVGWVGAATYEQAFDRSPNYGQTGKGYAQRLGAAARNSSEGIFTYALYSPIFHTDPRYYVLGPGHGFVHRATYAISRVLITKTDGGAQTINFALLAGNATGAAITQTYYPAGNRNLDQVLTTFGTSLGGSAVSYLFDEFIVNSAEFLQLKKKI